MEIKSKKSTTLRQVADRAGVSAATASLVLNGKGEISEATRSKVLTAVKELNYVPRGTRARADSTNTIRFLKIARHGQTVNRDHNHFISDYIDGMSFETMRRDYSLQVVSFEKQDIGEIINGMEGNDLRGLVILGTELSTADIEKITQRSSLPTVFIDTFHPFLKANFVDMDNDRLVFEALSHLKSRGFNRIGYVGSPSEVTNFRLREDAFRRAAAELNIETDPSVDLSVASTLEGAYSDSLEQLGRMDRPAAAYLCANDIIAFGFMRALRDSGLSVPGDVSVVGFDNLPMSSVFNPPLTSIDVPKKHIGALAARLLNNLIENPESQPNFKVLMTGELVTRQSVADPG